MDARGPSGSNSVSSWTGAGSGVDSGNGAGSGVDSLSSWTGAGSGVDSVSSWTGAGSGADARGRSGGVDTRGRSGGADARGRSGGAELAETSEFPILRIFFSARGYPPASCMNEHTLHVMCLARRDIHLALFWVRI